MKALTSEQYEEIKTQLRRAKERRSKFYKDLQVLRNTIEKNIQATHPNFTCIWSQHTDTEISC